MDSSGAASRRRNSRDEQEHHEVGGRLGHLLMLAEIRDVDTLAREQIPAQELKRGIEARGYKDGVTGEPPGDWGAP